jgi:hypothetical protein
MSAKMYPLSFSHLLEWINLEFHNSAIDFRHPVDINFTLNPVA